MSLVADFAVPEQQIDRQRIDPSTSRFPSPLAGADVAGVWPRSSRLPCQHGSSWLVQRALCSPFAGADVDGVLAGVPHAAGGHLAPLEGHVHQVWVLLRRLFYLLLLRR